MDLFDKKLQEHFLDFNVEYVPDLYSDEDYSYYKITLK